MHSGSVNVIYITVGGFTLLSHFCKLFEVVAAVKQQLQVAFNSP
jgi:hypothetical protein